MVDWSKAPEGAVDVRKGGSGNNFFTNGKDLYYDEQWLEMRFSCHDWPVVDVRPTATSALDWSKAPEGATYYHKTWCDFFKPDSVSKMALRHSDGKWVQSGYEYDELRLNTLFEPRPAAASSPDWSKCSPDIATHYGTVLNMAGFWHINGDDVRFSTGDTRWVGLKFQGDRTKLLEGLTPRPNRVILDGIAQKMIDTAKGVVESEIEKLNKPYSAQDFLSEGMRILGDRGKQYGSNERECSFPQVAQAFNAITGHELKASDVCLILALVKQVRQYAQPERFHEDSAVDGVNYTALQAQELKRERQNG